MRVSAQSIRVTVDTLEMLMTLVSELVLTHNQLLQMVRGRDDNEFAVPLQRLNHITSELQEGVMKTRMQPIGNAWAKLPRIIRDLAVETGKKLDLRMLGADTELDRQVLELIKDPLTHMVRNSADHGIEGPDERRRLGKPEIGTIVLNAFHEGGHIFIEISDDGRGLDTERIRRKAIASGVASETDAAAMSDQQVHQFIFRLGFSTAEKVTSVSGRGVGMDVVRTNIEKIGGTIELKSVAGKGSTFTIKIPLTLAIVSALIVECAGHRFAVPQINVLELVRIAPSSGTTIEMINKAPLLRLRDRLLPLVELTRLLRIDGPGDGHPDAASDVGTTTRTRRTDDVFIVVAQVGTYCFGIIVDKVFDTEEIVVKPVAPVLRGVPYYADNTILGDGSVIMILDPNGIAGTTGHTGAQAADQRLTKTAGAQAKMSFLIFRAGGEDLKAIPLELVARLEQVDMAMVERSQGRCVIQYRGQLMPLVPCNPDHQWAREGTIPVVVFTDRDRAMGLVVDEIVDVIEDQLKIEVSAEREGYLGSAVINGRATDVIDVGYYLARGFADWFSVASSEAFGGDCSHRILLVDDSAFFRNLLTPMLEATGYQVTAVGDAAKALELREEGHDFDAIISDIEMPGMNGFEFAKAVRDDRRWAQVPLVALSSYATEKDFTHGRETGFTDYVAKFDREGLMQSLTQTLAAVPAAFAQPTDKRRAA